MAGLQPSLAILRSRRLLPSIWDVLVFGLVIGLLAMIAFGGHETLQPLAVANRRPVSLDPVNLPYYALRTTLRMLLGLVFSFLFTFAYGALAQKSRRAEMILIPMLDILQSVPVIAFATFTLAFFLNLFPGNVMGAGYRGDGKTAAQHGRANQCILILLAVGCVVTR